MQFSQPKTKPTACSMAVAALLMALAAGAMHGSAAAQAAPVTSASAAKITFELAAQPLADALRAVAQKAGVNILFDPALTKGLSAPSISGAFTISEVLSRLLAGTGLRVESVQDGTLAIKVAGDKVSPALGEVGPSGTVGFPKVEVTGSRLKKIDAEGPVPVNIYRKADIDRSGQPTLERFLNSLNEASTPGEGSFGSTGGQGAVQMRGLPLGSTLVLINGRRIEAVGSSSANYFNMNLIPMAAVERVEILPVGSSAVYGGDALAGVVNVILKKSMDGVSFDARVGGGKGTGDASMSLATGMQGENGSFLVLGSFNKNTPLMEKDRAFFRDSDYRRFGGADTRTRNCSPGTVSSSTGANLPGLTSTFAGIPLNNGGQKLTVADFAASAGQANLCSNYVANGNGYALIGGAEDIALHATGDYRLSNSWSIFGELTYTQDKARVDENTFQLTGVTVPASNAFNPFGVPVLVTARLGPENGLTGLARNTDYTRAVFGLRGTLTPRWDLEATISTSRDDGNSVAFGTLVNTAARNAALASSDPATALNLFTTGRAASDSVLQSIWFVPTKVYSGQKNLASAFARGSLMDLPAGSLDALVGAESASESFKSSRPGVGGFNFDMARQTSAVYGELRAPLLRSSGATDVGWEIAGITVAGRRDHYSDFGSANTYQAGIEVRPQQTVLLRGATASSFKPPTLLQTNVSNSSFQSELFGLIDPARGGAPIVGAEILRTTNPGLAPENGRANTFGVVWEPESGSRFGITAWRVRINGLIALLSPQVLVNYESLFPGLVSRAPSVGNLPGAVTRVLWAEANIGSVDTSGVDIEAAHSWKTDAGKWNVGFSATRTSRYDVVLAPGAPTENRLGRFNYDFWAPQWKGRLSEGFATDTWSLGLTSRYLGAYKDSASVSARSAGSFWVHDLAGSVNLKKLTGLNGAKAATLIFSVLNIGNHQPEYVSSDPYYDVGQSDWRGRYFTARVSVDW